MDEERERYPSCSPILKRVGFKARVRFAHLRGRRHTEGLPTFEIARDKLIGIPLTTLADLAGLTSSASEARRHIEGGGLRVNDTAVKDVKAIVSASDISGQGVLKLSIGKKKHILVRPV